MNASHIEYIMSPFTVPPCVFSEILLLVKNGHINNNVAKKLIDYYIKDSDRRIEIRKKLNENF